MPRRRNPFAGRNRNPFGVRGGGFGAPPPVVVAAPVIDLPKLQLAYDWMLLDKMLGFKLVLEWYATNQVALLWKDPLTEDKTKTYNRALKAQQLGDAATIAGEKEQAWRTAITLYEKIWAHKAPNFPLLAAIDQATASKTPKPTSPEVINIQTVLNNLNAAFPACHFRVTFGSDREFLHGEILLPQAQLQAMVTQAPLAVALAEAPTVAKVMSIVTDPADGKQKLDGAQFMANLPQVLNQVGAWATSLGGAVNRPVGKPAPQPKQGKAQGQGPRAARQPNPNNFKVRDTDVIHLTGMANKAFKGGKRGQVWQMLQDGMTVAQLRQAASAIGGGYAVQVLKVMVSSGLVKLN